MNWLRKQMILNPASPKLRKIGLAVMAICSVLMIAIGQYWAALVWGLFFWVIISSIELKNEKAPRHTAPTL